MFVCPICGKGLSGNIMWPVHHCAPSAIRKRERELRREEDAEEEARETDSLKLDELIINLENQ